MRDPAVSAASAHSLRASLYQRCCRRCTCANYFMDMHRCGWCSRTIARAMSTCPYDQQGSTGSRTKGIVTTDRCDNMWNQHGGPQPMRQMHGMLGR